MDSRTQNGSRRAGKDFADMQNDIRESFFLNWLITDFEARALRLDNSARREHAQSKIAVNALKSLLGR